MLSPALSIPQSNIPPYNISSSSTISWNVLYFSLPLLSTAGINAFFVNVSFSSGRLRNITVKSVLNLSFWIKCSFIPSFISFSI